MAVTHQPVFKHKTLNGWRLFWSVAVLTTIAVIIPLSQIDASNSAHISEMIQHSVRLAVPWLFIAFAASALPVIYPSQFSRWVLRNRRIFGLCFAAGMAWQLFFILWMVFGHFDYYMNEAYSFYDLSEQIPGYLILFALTATSFHFGRKLLNRDQWRNLHKLGIYFLWFVVWTTYWFELFYYDDIQLIDHVFYWMGIGALGARMAAWVVKRKTKDPNFVREGSVSILSRLNLIVTWFLIATGMLLLIFGNSWAPPIIKYLATIKIGGWIELIIPFIAVIPLWMAALLWSRPPSSHFTKGENYA